MKIVFLDFDGVLNCHLYLTGVRWTNDELMLDTAAIERVNRLLEASGAKVVISSSWRHGWCQRRLEQMLKLRGFLGEVLGTTPMSAGTCRGHEIQAWLDKNPGVESFVILDDDSDMDLLMDRLVRTTFADGILDSHVDRALAVLTVPYCKAP